MKYVNLTAHPIKYLNSNGEFIEIPINNDGGACKVNYDIVQVDGGVKFKYNYVVGLPAPQPNTLYIVSATALNGIKELYPERDDVVAPYRVKKTEAGFTYCEGFRHNG